MINLKDICNYCNQVIITLGGKLKSADEKKEYLLCKTCFKDIKPKDMNRETEVEALWRIIRIKENNLYADQKLLEKVCGENSILKMKINELKKLVQPLPSTKDDIKKQASQFID